MFTGIIEATGNIAAVASQGSDVRLTIASQMLDFSDIKPGDSIAVNGVCLTVVELQADRFAVDVSAETLACTTVAGLAIGDRVNLEKALLPTTRLGGHLVSGHVDGVARVVDQRQAGQSRILRFTVAAELQHYIAQKGSIAVDGVSLTINQVTGHEFEVNIIPHTLAHTTIADYQVGNAVNIEVDMMARYLERLLGARAETTVTLASLHKAGFSAEQ